MVCAVTEGRRLGRRIICREIYRVLIGWHIRGGSLAQSKKMQRCYTIKWRKNKKQTSRRQVEGISKVDDGRRREDVKGLCYLPTNYQRCPCDVLEKSNDSATSQRTTSVVRSTSLRSWMNLRRPNELPVLSVRRPGEVEWLCYVPTNYQRCPYDVPDKSKDSVTSNKLPALSLR